MKFSQWLAEEKRSEFQVLKQNKTPLDGEERDEAMKAGCVWHFTDTPSCAIYKSKDTAGKTWYASNTHRTYAKSPTLKQAIAQFFKVVKPSS